MPRAVFGEPLSKLGEEAVVRFASVAVEWVLLSEAAEFAIEAASFSNKMFQSVYAPSGPIPVEGVVRGG